MKLTGTNRHSYPKTWARINSLSSRLSPRKYAAFEKHGHADRAKVKAACDPNSRPDFVIVLFGADKDGQINPITWNPEINEILVKAFEKGVITGEQLDRVVEHELATGLSAPGPRRIRAR